MKENIIKIIKRWTPRKTDTDKVFRLLYNGDIESIADEILAMSNSKPIDELIEQYKNEIKQLKLKEKAAIKFSFREEESMLSVQCEQLQKVIEDLKVLRNL